MSFSSVSHVYSQIFLYILHNLKPGLLTYSINSNSFKSHYIIWSHHISASQYLTQSSHIEFQCLKTQRESRNLLGWSFSHYSPAWLLTTFLFCFVLLKISSNCARLGSAQGLILTLLSRNHSWWCSRDTMWCQGSNQGWFHARQEPFSPLIKFWFSLKPR